MQVRGKGSRVLLGIDQNLSSQDIVSPVQLLGELQQVVAQMQELKKDTKLIQLGMWARSDAIPKAFKEALEHAFKCKTCQSVPFKAPIILATCCSNIIGCQTCVDTWFSGPNALNRNCPICQQECGYAHTSTLHGLDKVAAEVEKLFTSMEPKPLQATVGSPGPEPE